MYTLQCLLCDHLCPSTNNGVISHFLCKIFKCVFLGFIKMELIWYLHRTLQFLTRRNTTEVITRARINAEADDLSHSVSTHIS